MTIRWNSGATTRHAGSGRAGDAVAIVRIARGVPPGIPHRITQRRVAAHLNP